MAALGLVMPLVKSSHVFQQMLSATRALSYTNMLTGLGFIRPSIGSSSHERLLVSRRQTGFANAVGNVVFVVFERRVAIRRRKAVLIRRGILSSSSRPSTTT